MGAWPTPAKLSDRSATITTMQNYTYRAQWSQAYGEYEGRCAEFPTELFRAPTPHAAVEGIERLVAEAVAECVEQDIPPPRSLADRPYSGKFMVRTSPELHAKLMLEAAEQGVSFDDLF